MDQTTIAIRTSPPRAAPAPIPAVAEPESPPLLLFWGVLELEVTEVPGEVGTEGEVAGREVVGSATKDGDTAREVEIANELADDPGVDEEVDIIRACRNRQKFAQDVKQISNLQLQTNTSHR